METPEPLRTANNRKWAYGLLLLATIGLLSFVGFQHLFSTFAMYDDEGYVMISLQSFVDGHPLYDETFSQYGPGYYFAQQLFHGAGRLPISHDVTRLKTLVVWTAAALLCCSFLWRVTRSYPVALCGLVAVFLHLDRLSLEPGHPQEFVVLSIALSLWLATFIHREASRASRLMTLSMLAWIAAWMVMTKLNVGVFLIAALVLYGFAKLAKSRISNILFLLSTVGAICLPFLLQRSVLFDEGGAQLPLSVAVTLGLVSWVVAKTQRSGDADDHFTFGQIGVGVLAAITMVVSLIVATLISGTSTEGLWHGLVTQHLAFTANFHHPIHIFSWPLLMIAGIVVFAIRSQSKTAEVRSGRLILAGQALLLAALMFSAFAYLVETTKPLTHGLNSRGNPETLLMAMPAMACLLLRGDARSKDARLLLCLMAPLQTLAAFPTPGTQLAVGSFALILAGLVATHDLLSPHLQVKTFAARRFCLPAFQLLAVLLMVAVVFRAQHVHSYRSQLKPLALPGAQLMWLPENEVAQYRDLVQALKANSDTFVFSEHSVNSIYFWAELPPPTSANATFWPYLLSPEQQAEIREQLIAKSPRVRVIRHPSIAADIRPTMLRSFLNEYFEYEETVGKLELWRPREQQKTET